MTSNQSTSNNRGPQYWLWYLWYHDWWYILSLADQQPAPPSQSYVPIYLAKILNIFLEVWKHHFNSMKYWELMSILMTSTLHWIWILACLGLRDNQQSCHLDTGRCHLDQLSPARQHTWSWTLACCCDGDRGSCPLVLFNEFLFTSKLFNSKHLFWKTTQIFFCLHLKLCSRAETEGSSITAKSNIVGWRR